MKKWLSLFVLFIGAALPALGQTAAQTVPYGILDPVAMVALDPTGNFKYMSLNQVGALVDGGGVGQTASGPYGYVAPVAPVAIDPNGNWQFLKLDVNGNLMTLGGTGGTGTGTGGTVTPFTGGTLSSPLYLFENPKTALEAANKAYVDQQVAGITLSSNPTFQNIAASQLTLSGAMNAASATISGLLTAGSISVTNAILSGSISAASGSLSGTFSVGGASTFNTLAANSISVPAIAYTGSGAFIFGGNPQPSDPTGSTATYPQAYWGSDQIFRTMDTSHNIRKLGDALTVNGAALPVSASCTGTNSLGQIVSASCSGGAGSMIYPTGTGIAVVTGGSAWGTTLAAPTSTIVGINDTQTLTNKTIASTEITGLPAFPTSTIVGINDTQTLTNKSIASTEITGLPAFPTGAVVGISDTQTLTNKSIAASEINSGNLSLSVLPSIAANTVLLAITAGPPIAMGVPSCVGTGQALTWNPGVGFGCTTISGSGGAVITTTTVSMQEDWIGGSSNSSGGIGSNSWSTSTIGGTAATYALTGFNNHPGVEQITTAATTSTGGALFLGNVGTIDLGGTTNWSAVWIAQINPSTAGAYRIGFMPAATSGLVPSSGVYFRYDNSKPDAKIMACVTSATTESCTATSSNGVGAFWYDFYISSVTPGTIQFQINANTPVTICASGCTGTATPPSTFLAPAVSVSATSAAAAALWVDYFQFTQTVTR